MGGSVLVVGAHLRAGLATIRSLGARGIAVAAISPERVSPGFASRYCHRCVTYRDRDGESSPIVHAVLKELRSNSYDALIPAGLRSTLALAPHRSELAQLTRLPFTDAERMMIFRDKARGSRLADSLGLKTPLTMEVDDAETAERVARDIGFPVILKPRVSSGSEGLSRVERAEDVRPTFERVSRRMGSLMLQEYIPWGGETYGVGVLMNASSEPRVAFGFRRIRMYPPIAGTNAYGQGVIWPELAEMAVSLLRAVRWYGPAQVEFRVDPRDGRPVFVEVNGALWGTVFLAMVSGVDVPHLTYRMAVDGDVEPALQYRTDVKARWLVTEDLLCLLTHPRRHRILGSWLGAFFDRKTRMYLWSWRDPLPLLAKLLATPLYGLRPARLRRRLGRHAWQRL